jgi:hypothetical protein
LSPLLIDVELRAVTDWLKTRDDSDEDEMKVKVSKATKEVTAIYPIDDQAMEIVVRLPPLFPLRQVQVVGLRRVGLDEKRFKQMQLASQAVVNFQVLHFFSLLIFLVITMPILSKFRAAQ